MPQDKADELAAITVRPVQRLDGRITLADYDADWPVLFEREATRIRGALGDRAIVVEHAGSTSVPGLAAKPLIDIVLGVPDSTDEAAFVPALDAAGYVLHLREPEWHEHRLFKGPDTNVNVHTFTAGDSEIRKMLLFRDWLRTHDEDRLRYERAKRELATRDWDFVQSYADAKTDVVAEILARAGWAEPA